MLMLVLMKYSIRLDMPDIKMPHFYNTFQKYNAQNAGGTDLKIREKDKKSVELKLEKIRKGEK